MERIIKVETLFKKNSGGKNTIIYRRTGMEDYWFEADDFLVLHDLSHYAIETKLNYKNAFWGLIQSGINPVVFENKVERDKILISDEAWTAECLANLFVIELNQGIFEDFQNVFRETFQQFFPNKTKPELSYNAINEIRAYYTKLILQWKSLEKGQVLALTF